MPRPRARDRDRDEDSPSHDAFQPTARTARPAWDDEEHDREASTYALASAHGPSPVPDWVITEDAARQHERGIIKTGKEADVHLVERVLGDRVNLLAAKRYRDLDERSFKADATARQLAGASGGRGGGGLTFRAQAWLDTEFDALGRLWEAGAPVPYPVQKLGVEVMLEYLGDEDEAAPRLVDAVRGRSKAERLDLFLQLREALRVMTTVGLVHGDLSPYNLLVWDDRLWVIDLPQAVDPILRPEGLGVLQRDVENLCSWFRSKGVDEADPVEIHRELLGLLRLRS